MKAAVNDYNRYDQRYDNEHNVPYFEASDNHHFEPFVWDGLLLCSKCEKIHMVSSSALAYV